MQKLGDFKLPHFFNYPPYFTLQPVRDTREKQIQVQLWKELILDYCKTQKIFVIGLEEEFPLFTNHVIERSLTHEARATFLSALVSEGRAEWMDKGHRKCLILWHRIQDWADILIQFAKDNGLEDGVVTIEEIRSGTESQGTVESDPFERDYVRSFVWMAVWVAVLRVSGPLVAEFMQQQH
uniref:Vacuolar protein sorting-associated protein 25 n=1 Tax=Cajanus cajan TaxID=3821 RepID=A0A151UFV3_CAJCA